MFLRMLLLVGCLLLLPLAAQANSRYIIEGINVGAGSGLTQKFEVEFVDNKISKIFAKGVSAGGGQRIVAVACMQPDGEIFIDTFTDSAVYSLYKVKVNEAGKQALFIFGFSEDTGTSRTVSEARIIAVDETGNIVDHKVRGFAPVVILKTPMQLNSDKELFFTEMDGSEVVFRYDAAKGDFTFTRNK